MTPATSIAKNYKEGKFLASKPVAKTRQMPRQNLAAKLDAGINWFSRNLTGQQKRSSGAMSDF
ncbi:MAG: hypothetical protein JWP00_2595 [Chloroflexi bacterium]|jgi:hypothetical protein|nr:hypothetical protein [Chloroflexota bacterium]